MLQTLGKDIVGRDCRSFRGRYEQFGEKPDDDNDDQEWAVDETLQNCGPEIREKMLQLMDENYPFVCVDVYDALKAFPDGSSKVTNDTVKRAIELHPEDHFYSTNGEKSHLSLMRSTSGFPFRQQISYTYRRTYMIEVKLRTILFFVMPKN